ncbi:MAG: hypothetical protein H0V81_02720 [Solirubrobacterales bacterium]|nr:hypothetical protein [Solirubrobacterales bacterium]
MQTATLTRQSTGTVPAPAGPPTRRRLDRLPAACFALLAVGALVAFLVYPTYPNYDSYYSLLWGRELLDGVKPSFDVYRAPTQHPLAVFFGAGLSLLGDGADRVMIAATFVSFLLLAAGLYRLGRVAFTPAVGLVAAILLCTRFDFAFLAARGYIDVAYLAAVIWAVALEASRPHRGTSVFVLLALAALMRPEAWLLSGAYFLWMFRGSSWRQRGLYAALTWIGPAIWVSLDWWATGDPLFSQTHTSELAGSLGRNKPIGEVPGLAVKYLINLDKAPIFAAGLGGLALAVYLVPRRVSAPAAVWGVGLGTFLLIGLAGLSVIDRYLLVPSLMMMVFAGVAFAGWSMLEPGRVRTGWMAAAGILALAAVAYTVPRISLTSFDTDLRFRGESHTALEQVLAAPAVQRGLACGPVSVPSHKLVPDTRWILDRGEAGVYARADPEGGAQPKRDIGRLPDRGVALFVVNRTAMLRQAIVDSGDDPLDSVPAPGWVRAATTPYYAAYVKC